MKFSRINVEVLKYLKNGTSLDKVTISKSYSLASRAMNI